MFITRPFPKRRSGAGRTLFIPGSMIHDTALDVDTVSVEVSSDSLTIRPARPREVTFPCLAYGEMVLSWAELHDVAGRAAAVEGGE